MQSCSGCTLCSFYRFHIEFSCNGEPGTKSYAGWIKFGRVIGGRGFTKMYPHRSLQVSQLLKWTIIDILLRGGRMVISDSVGKEGGNKE